MGPAWSVCLRHGLVVFLPLAAGFFGLKTGVEISTGLPGLWCFPPWFFGVFACPFVGCLCRLSALLAWLVPNFKPTQGSRATLYSCTERLRSSTGFGSVRSKLSGPFEARPVPFLGVRRGLVPGSLCYWLLNRAGQGCGGSKVSGPSEARAVPRMGGRSLRDLSLLHMLAPQVARSCVDNFVTLCLLLISDRLFQVEAEEAASGCARTCPPEGFKVFGVFCCLASPNLVFDVVRPPV